MGFRVQRAVHPVLDRCRVHSKHVSMAASSMHLTGLTRHWSNAKWLDLEQLENAVSEAPIPPFPQTRPFKPPQLVASYDMDGCASGGILPSPAPPAAGPPDLTHGGVFF